MFDYHWDKLASVLVIGLGIHKAELPEGILIVEVLGDDGSANRLAVGRAESRSQYFAVRLPDFESSLTLQVRVARFDGADNQPESDRIRLSKAQSSPSTYDEATRWLVTMIGDGDRGDTADICVDHPENVPDGEVISKPYVTNRAGLDLFPATVGSADGDGGQILVDFQPDDKDDDKLNLIIERDLGSAVAPPVTVSTYTLGAVRHVLPLIRNRPKRIMREENFQILSLKSDKKAVGHIPFAGGGAVAKYLGFLDRIVIETQPKARFFATINDQRVEVGTNGVAVFVRAYNREILPDHGAVAEIIAAAEDDLRLGAEGDFASALRGARMVLAPADRDAASDVTCFVYSAADKHLGAASGGHSLRPNSLAHFLNQPEFFSLLTGLPSEMFDHGIVGTLRKASLEKDTERRCELTAKAILDDTMRRRPNFFDGPSAKRIRLWLSASQVSGWDKLILALADDLQDVVAAGLDPSNEDLDVLMSFAKDSGTRADCSYLRTKLDLLTGAGVIGEDFASQFTSIENLDSRLRDLEELVEATDRDIQDLGHQLGLGTALRSGEVLFESLERAAEYTPPRDRFSGLALHFFEEKIGEKFADWGRTVSALLPNRVARVFYQVIREDISAVNQIVSCGYPSPIDLQHGKVHTLIPGYADPSVTPLVRPLGAELSNWLERTDSAPIVNSWRKKLRASVRPTHEAKGTGGEAV